MTKNPNTMPPLDLAKFLGGLKKEQVRESFDEASSRSPDSTLKSLDNSQHSQGSDETPVARNPRGKQVRFEEKHIINVERLDYNLSSPNGSSLDENYFQTTQERREAEKSAIKEKNSAVGRTFSALPGSAKSIDEKRESLSRWDSQSSLSSPKDNGKKSTLSQSNNSQTDSPPTVPSRNPNRVERDVPPSMARRVDSDDSIGGVEQGIINGSGLPNVKWGMGSSNRSQGSDNSLSNSVLPTRKLSPYKPEKNRVNLGSGIKSGTKPPFNDDDEKSVATANTVSTNGTNGSRNPQPQEKSESNNSQTDRTPTIPSRNGGNEASSMAIRKPQPQENKWDDLSSLGSASISLDRANFDDNSIGSSQSIARSSAKSEKKDIPEEISFVRKLEVQRTGQNKSH